MTTDAIGTAIVRPVLDPAIVEQVLLAGDLAKLSAPQRISYYHAVCQSVGLNPLTKPFDYITLSGKLTLYAKKDATDQLRKIHGVSITKLETSAYGDVYIITAYAQDATGRTDAATGAVPIGTLKGDALANALMKTETKAKRRVTLSICGLGMLDETELETIPNAVSPTVVVRATEAAAYVNTTTGEVTNEASAATSVATDGPLLRIIEVTSTPTRNKNVTRWAITLSDGRVLQTIKTRLGSLCEQFCQEAAPVTVETSETKWGLELIAIYRLVSDQDGMRDRETISGGHLFEDDDVDR